MAAIACAEQSVLFHIVLVNIISILIWSILSSTIVPEHISGGTPVCFLSAFCIFLTIFSYPFHQCCGPNRTKNRDRWQTNYFIVNKFKKCNELTSTKFGTYVHFEGGPTSFQDLQLQRTYMLVPKPLFWSTV